MTTDPSLTTSPAPAPAPTLPHAGLTWEEHVRRGDFAAAWEMSDAVLRARRGGPADWHRPRHEQAVWDGSPLTGRRVLVRCYHGLGDTVQFIRYAPRLKAVAAEVIVWAQPALLPLLGRAGGATRGIDRLLPLHDGAPDAAYDVDVEIMELPHVFRTTLETIPAGSPYLVVDPAPLPPPSPPGSEPAAGFGSGSGSRPDGRPPREVGLVWRAGDWDQRRSVPFGSLRAWFELPGIRWHVLQRGAGLAERPEGWGIVTGSDRIEDVAGVMRALDLVITVDSLPAHLAGALGRPTWTLLPAPADWRWLAEREDSPWYPTMRLFRQPRPGDWGPVIDRVTAELAGWSRGESGLR